MSTHRFCLTWAKMFTSCSSWSSGRIVRSNSFPGSLIFTLGTRLDPGKSMSFAILENLISAFSDMEYTFELYCLKKIAEKTTQG